MPPRWPRSAWTFLAAALLAGCLPRPQFKVSATNIGSDVSTLLARVWLADPDLTVNPAGGLAIRENKISESVPFDLTAQIGVTRCDAEDMLCLQRGHEYSFGVDYPTDTMLPQSVALLGLVALSAPPTTPGGCLLGVTSGEVSLADPMLTPPTLTVSFLKGGLLAMPCISLGSQPMIAAATFDHTARVDKSELDIVTIDGWGFRPDLSVIVNTGCKTIPLAYATQPTGANTSQILSVTPSRIIVQLAMTNLLDTCATPAPKSVQVVVNQPPAAALTTAVFTLN